MRSNATPAANPRSVRAVAVTAAVAAQVRRAVLDAIVRLGDDVAAAPAALTVPRGREPIAPARLAEAHPGGAAREEARRLYERCLAHYRSVVRAQDQAREVDDVGAAVAAFVAANLSTLQGTRVTPHMLSCLERQLGGVARLSSDWASAPLRERQAYFEQMAVLAVLVAESSAQAASQGAAAQANVQRAARGYLQQLLGLDPGLLLLGPDGLAAYSPASTN